MPQSQSSLPAGYQADRGSLLAIARGDEGASARQALIELCLRYAFPVYAYLRGCGHDAPVSRDILRSFFEDLVHHRARGEVGEGGFRHFLLQTLNQFLGGDWRFAVEAPPVPEIDRQLDGAALERRFRSQAQSSRGPEQGFERGYAVEVLESALRRLASEAEGADRGALYAALKPMLSREPLVGEIEALARDLQLAPLAVLVALKRLRQRFRELALSELMQTVNSAEDLAAERAHLGRSLGL